MNGFRLPRSSVEELSVGSLAVAFARGVSLVVVF